MESTDLPYIKDKVVREFINPPHRPEPYVIVCSINAMNLSIDVSSCRQTITLHSYIETAQNYKDALYKVQAMRRVLQEMEYHLLEYREKFELAEELEKEQ